MTSAKTLRDEERAHKLAKSLPPRMRLYLAYSLLVQLREEGCSYADFQAAKATATGIRKACNVLRHCN